MALILPAINAPDIPKTASKVSQSQYCRPNDISIDLIAEVARNIASKLDAECERQGKYIGENLGLSYPTPWWIEGG